MQILFPLVLLGVMYAFLIVPQRKRQKAHQQLLRALSPGDEILTTGGIYGGVTEIDGDDVYIEIAPDVEVKIARRFVAERLTSTTPRVTPEPPALGESSPGDDTSPSSKKK